MFSRNGASLLAKDFGVGFIGWLGDFVIASEIETAELPESWRKFLSL
jgi:hypothetical protein